MVLRTKDASLDFRFLGRRAGISLACLSTIATGSLVSKFRMLSGCSSLKGGTRFHTSFQEKQRSRP